MQDKQLDEDLNETERNAWLDLQGLIRKSQSSERSGCCAGPAVFVQSYGMQYELENPLSGVTIKFFFQKFSANSVTNTVKDFTKI
jgi:hypothetical protein